MIDREALAAALHKHDYLRTTWQTHFIEDDSPILAAARKTLTQLPEQCGTCGGKSMFDYQWESCPTCHGSGRVYPVELVERIAKVFGPDSITSRRWAGAVLDALNGETL